VAVAFYILATTQSNRTTQYTYVRGDCTIHIGGSYEYEYEYPYEVFVFG
jgi:hypothetical protein